MHNVHIFINYFAPSGAPSARNFSSVLDMPNLPTGVTTISGGITKKKSKEKKEEKKSLLLSLFCVMHTKENIL